MNYVIHWLLLVHVVLFPLSLLMNALLWLWLLPGLVTFIWWYTPLLFPHRTSKADSVELAAMTWNTLKPTEDAQLIVEVLDASGADVIALQEVSRELKHAIQQQLAQQFPYQRFETDQTQKYEGMAILSKYPITAYHIEKNRDAERSLGDMVYMRVELDIHGLQVAVYNLHPPLPQMTPLIKYDDRHNQAHLEQFIQAAEIERLPLLMMGDCNVPPRSTQHRRLRQLMRDVLDTRAWGFGSTFLVKRSMPFPLIRIDYIWYNDHFRALDVHIKNHHAKSDHLPVLARFDLVPQGGEERMKGIAAQVLDREAHQTEQHDPVQSKPAGS